MSDDPKAAAGGAAPVSQPPILELFSELEIALYGKAGNAWEKGRADRVMDILRRAQGSVVAAPPQEQDALQDLIKEWRERDHVGYDKEARWAFRVCADDLERYLSALPVRRGRGEPPEEEKKDVESRGESVPEGEHGDLPRPASE